MSAEGAKLANGWLELTVSTEGAQKSLVNEIGAAGEPAGRKLSGSLLGVAAKVAGPLAAALGIGKVIATGFDEVKDAAAGTAQLAAGIASTGNAAHVSVAGMNDLASSIQASTGQTDDSIVAAQSLLLTFTNIKNVGPDKIFNQATQAAADMAARMGGDASSKAVLLGKALNDPVKGITALTRVGVAFTEQQKSQIQQMVAAGDTLGAQKLILGELNKEFGGSAAAFGKTLPGQIERAKRSFEDLSQSAIGAFTPIISGGLELLITGMQALGPAVSAGAAAIGPIMAQVGQAIAPLFAQIGQAIGPLLPQLVQLWTSFSPLGIILQAIMPVLPQLASAFGQLATTVGGALGQALIVLMPVVQQLAGILVTALSAALGAILPVIVQLVGVIGPIFSTVLQALMPVILALAGVLVQLLQAFLPILTPILGLLPPLAQLIGALLPPLVQLFVALLQPILALIQPILGLLTPALNLIATVLGVVIGWIVQAITWFVKLVTGNQEAGAQLRGVWEGLMGFFRGIGSFFAGIWSGLVSGVSGFVGKVVGFFKDIPGKIGAVFAGAGRWLWDAGTNIVQGLINGAQSLLRNIGSFFLNLLPGWIVGPFKAALGINSPSKVFFGFGENTMDGYLNGVTSKYSKVQATVQKVGTFSLAGASTTAFAGAAESGIGGGYTQVNHFTGVTDIGDAFREADREKRRGVYASGSLATAEVS